MHGYIIRTLERRKSADEIHLVRRQILAELLALSLDHHVLAVHEILHRQAVFQRVVDAIETALLNSRVVERGFAENLAGNRSGVDACASQNRTTFDKRDSFAKIGSLRGAFFTCRAGADYDEIILFHPVFSLTLRSQPLRNCGMRTTHEVACSPGAAG